MHEAVQDAHAGETWACACLNVRVRGTRTVHGEALATECVRVGTDDDISVAIPVLTSLEVGKAPLGAGTSDAEAALVYHVTCRICHTHVYTLPKSKAKAPTQHAQGFDAASDAAATRTDARTAEGYVRPTDGYVWVTASCIQEPGITQVRTSPAYSDLFGVAIPPSAQPRHLERPELRTSSSSRNAIMSPYALQSLPASLLGADAQRSDLATEIDAAALKALREHRARADREISALVRSKQAELDALVNRARDQVGVLAGLAKASRDIGGSRSRSKDRSAGRAASHSRERSADAESALAPEAPAGGTSPVFAKRRVTPAEPPSGPVPGTLTASLARMGSTPSSGAPSAEPAAHAHPANTQANEKSEAAEGYAEAEASPTGSDPAAESGLYEEADTAVNQAAAPPAAESPLGAPPGASPGAPRDETVFKTDEDVEAEHCDEEPAEHASHDFGDAPEPARRDNARTEAHVARILNTGMATSFSAIPELQTRPAATSASRLPRVAEEADKQQGPYDLAAREVSTPGSRRRPLFGFRHEQRRLTEEEEAISAALAANMPSHRNSRKLQRASRYYAAEDDEKWAAWQRRVQGAPANAAQAAEDAAPSAPRLYGSLQTPRDILVPVDRSARNERMAGLDREPKTSLPYNERKFVPSLRQALQAAETRRAESAARKRPSVPAPVIADMSRSVRTTGFHVPGQRAGDGGSRASAVSRSSISASAGAAAPRSASISASTGPDLPPLPVAPSAHVRLPTDAASRPQALPAFQDPMPAWNEKELDDMLYYMHYLQNLKLGKRTGWYHHKVPHPESIADHMYRMAMLAMFFSDDGLDINKCVKLALVHDLAEARVGDLTPLCDVEDEEKTRREHQTIEHFTHELLHHSTTGKQIEALWNEYESRSTPEARLVKDLDRFELCLQALEYERMYSIRDLQPFWRGALLKVQHPRVRSWCNMLLRKREELWRSRNLLFDVAGP